MDAGDAARLNLLFELGSAFAAHIELDELVPLVIAKCRDVLDAEGASVLLLDETGSTLYFPYVVGRDAEVTAQLLRLRFSADAGLAGDALATGRPLKVDDTQSDPRFFREIDEATGVATRSLMAVPLIGRRGPIGVLEVVNRRSGRGFPESDLEFAAALAGSIAIALENAQLYAIVKASEETLRSEVGALRRDIARRDRFDEIIATSACMSQVFHLMEKAAASPISVLIHGETGTGKELVARGIHRAGERASRPFIAVNCAAVAETLLESELFGHKRGAFTGAMQDRRGLFEAANGGTIFLDEVGEMPSVMQAKLLRVLQEGEVTPVGETRPRKVDVRVVAATNRDLMTEVATRSFREDLYYRLAQFPIALPPLRERPEDIALIAARFLAAAARRHRKSMPGISRQAMDLLVAYPWPGNVRQLQNEIERAVALATSGEVITPTHLSAAVCGDGDPAGRSLAGAAASGGLGTSMHARAVAAALHRAAAPTAPMQRPGAGEAKPPFAPAVDPAVAGAGMARGADGERLQLREARERFEIAFITEALRAEGGNVTRAAQAVGLSRVMLQRKMRDYGLR
ncbi:MAG TPA: sigma 54-interacting transcriptional regulator [Candidatus Binatia bacterium]|nr:sigma 54-interacting transcriptional regulator [Candidatus Binatia bacterium]